MRNVGLLALVAAAIILTTTLVFSGAPALAQEGATAMQDAGARLQAEQARAQADAARPGDDLLTCEQLQAEMGATMNSEEMQTQRSEIGAPTGASAGSK
jgi:hypothetical protein